MGRTKVVIYFESDTLTPMQVLDTLLEELAMKKGDWHTPMTLRCDPLIEITDYRALDYVGKEIIMEKGIPREVI